MGSLDCLAAPLVLEDILLDFTKHFFKAWTGSRFLANSHHHRIVEALEKVVSGEIRNLIINTPPRYGKTELTVINFVAWCMARNPNAKFILATRPACCIFVRFTLKRPGDTAS